MPRHALIFEVNLAYFRSGSGSFHKPLIVLFIIQMTVSAIYNTGISDPCASGF
jgi:hypothetical protein